MAKRNTNYAIFALIAVVILSVFLYGNFEATGKQITVLSVACSSHTYLSACEAAGCTWDLQQGCQTPSEIAQPESIIIKPSEPITSLPSEPVTSRPSEPTASQPSEPVATQPPRIVTTPLPITDSCSGLSWLRCIFTQGCEWKNSKCVKKGGISVYDHCKNNVKDADESDIDCGGIIGPPYCQKCADGKNCLLNSDCQSDFCDTVADIRINQGTPTYKCITCTAFNKDDNIQNCGETGVDCPDWNYPCECFNGEHDADINESMIDCSDSLSDTNPQCPFCTTHPFNLVSGGAPHCFDGILNKGEACTDCGGTCSQIQFRTALPYCCTEKFECESNNYYWCAGIQKCWPEYWETDGLLKSSQYRCITDKTECEAKNAGYGSTAFVWCPQHKNSHGESSWPCTRLTECYPDETACNNAGYNWCHYYSECREEKLSLCYTTKTGCEQNGFFWCTDTQTCSDKENSGCYKSKSTCEKAGYFWCTNYNDCREKEQPWCWGDKTTCESKGYKWCWDAEDGVNICLDVTSCL